MQVKYGLPAAFTRVDDSAVAFGDAANFSGFAGFPEEAPCQRIICSGEIVERREVPTWNDEQVHRGKRLKGFDDDAVLVLIITGSGRFLFNDAAEDTIFHINNWLQYLYPYFGELNHRIGEPETPLAFL